MVSRYRQISGQRGGQTIPERFDGCIGLVDGGYYYFFNPTDSDITIETISWALGNICRFTGHTKRHYSVAQHSVFVSNLTGKAGFSLHCQLYGLLHDAHEAFLGDVSSPLKALIRTMYEPLAETCQSEINYRLMGFAPSIEDIQLVGYADAMSLNSESMELRGYPCKSDKFGYAQLTKWFGGYDQDSILFEELKPNEAAERMESEFFRLTKLLAEDASRS